MTTTASQPALSPAEELEILFGPHPLLTFRGRFSSRDELLRFYAEGVAAHFSPATLDVSKCEMCGSCDPLGSVISSDWSARSKVRWRTLAVFAIFSPVLGLLALAHLGSLLAAILRQVRFADTVDFRTVHRICVRCQRRLKARELAHGAFLVVFGFAGAVSTIGAIIMAAVVIEMTVGGFGLAPGDAVEIYPYLLLAAAVSVFSFVIGSFLGIRILLPRALRVVVKRPFRLIRTAGTARDPARDRRRAPH